MRRLPLRHAFAVAVLGLMTAYVALAWTPSSYGIVLENLGAERTGLVFGEPRENRFDEWNRWTPFFQVAVRNEFRRYNETSLYGEDLRSVEGLPLLDWGLIFKPYFWPFFVADPAHAFSFFHAFWIAAFLIGYERVFRRIGLAGLPAALASLTLFFTSFAQIWWTNYATVLGGFPWVILVWLADVRPWLRALAAAYVVASWLLAALYPPIQITMGFAAAVAVLAWLRPTLNARRALPFVLGVGAGGGLAFLYYLDVFFEMAGTHYPGLRRSSGGGESLAHWYSQFFPTLVTDGQHFLASVNVSEASSVGTFLPILLLVFVRWRDFVARLDGQDTEARELRAALGVTLAGVFLASFWLLAPVPEVIGRLFLWHLVPPHRMWFVCGFLLFLVSLGALRHAPLALTWGRFAVLVAVLLGVGLAVQVTFDSSKTGVFWQSAVPLVAAVGVVRMLGERLAGHRASSLLACAAVANMVAFGGFNPIQSAKPIFLLPELAAREALDRLAERHDRGWLVLAGQDDALMNGVGYRSLSHILYAPNVEFFRRRFPLLSEEILQWTFNRTHQVAPGSTTVPIVLYPSLVLVPIDAFDPPTLAVEVGSIAARPELVVGEIEGRSVYDESDEIHLFVHGWGRMDGSRPDALLEVETQLPVSRAVAYPKLRTEPLRSTGDGTLALSGFEMRITLRADRWKAPLARLLAEPMCIVSTCPVHGRHAVDTGADCGRP